MPRKTAQPGHVRIGLSGWVYREWRGTFYPDDLAQKNELAFAAQIFNSLEINSTFYGTQSADSFKRWHDEVPKDFQFSVKGPRYITHVKRLRDFHDPLAYFFASGPLRLGAKLGPVLWQLPPNFKFNADTIESFLAGLPPDSAAAAKMARGHGSRTKARWTKTDATRPIRHALEIRHESFLDQRFIEILRRYNIALVCADTVDWPRVMDVTADFVYCRLHGSSQLYVTNYSARDISTWADRVVAWTLGNQAKGEYVAKTAPTPRIPRDVFLYFDNTAKVHAPANAVALYRKVMKKLQGSKF
jgi:uncharacterized protein YecE (DUF72 family)